MDWHLYRKDDPSTWPEIDCPMLVYVKYRMGTEELHVCRFDKRFKKFYGMTDLQVANHAFAFTECYYQYIGYVPNGYKAFKTKKCILNPEYGCEYEDDGYCCDGAEDDYCEYCEEVTEYSLNDNKRIWKELD